MTTSTSKTMMYKKSSYFKYWDVNNLYGWIMSQTLPVDSFKWVEETSQFNKDLIKKAIMKISI